MDENLIAYVASPETREAVERAAVGRFDPRFCSTAEALVSLAVVPRWAKIVCETSAHAEFALQSVMDATKTRKRPISLLLILDMTTAAVRQVLMLLNHECRLHLSLRWHDNLVADITSFHAESCDREASSVILRRLVPLVPLGAGRAQRVLVNAALLAHRRMTVRAFAALCGSSARALEWTQRAVRMVPVKDLLGWMVSLHALWRLDVLGWNSKRTWSTGGFPNHAAFAHYIARHAGAAPARLLRAGGFVGLLARCEQKLVVGARM